MVTFAVMLAFLMALGLIMLYKADIDILGDRLFDKDSTCALRGFWSIVVILVHVPQAFQNPLQDMVGSFGYIGVTFFFMTSAYGLKMLVSGQRADAFWRRRLPKLLIPMFCANAVNLLMCRQFSVFGLIEIDGWVRWLLYCYLLFWIACKANLKHKDLFISVGVILLSICWFAVSPGGGWPTEIYGFIWGLLLADKKEKLTKPITIKRWLMRGAGIAIVSAILGLLYLKYKSSIFWGSYLLKIILGASLILLMLWINRGIRFGNRVNLFLGRISYETYLIHASVMGVLGVTKPDMGSAMFIVVSVACTILLSTVIHKISSCIVKRIQS